MKYLNPSLPMKAWGFLFILALAPIAVGIIEGVFLTNWPEKQPLLGDLVNYHPQQTVIIWSLVCAFALVASGWLTLTIPSIKRIQQLPKWIHLAIIGTLILMLLGLLWLELIFIFTTTFFEFYLGPILGWPRMPLWITTIGWTWTTGILLFLSRYFKQQLG